MREEARTAFSPMRLIKFKGGLYGVERNFDTFLDPFGSLLFEEKIAISN